MSQVKSPIDYFFKLGEKATKGDPQRQADFVYYMVWILFIAFGWLFIYNAYELFFHKNLNSATWTLVGFAICGIQYFSLKGMHEQRKMRKQFKQAPTKEDKIEPVDEMLEGFKDKIVKKEDKK